MPRSARDSEEGAQQAHESDNEAPADENTGEYNEEESKECAPRFMDALIGQNVARSVVQELVDQGAKTMFDKYLDQRGLPYGVRRVCEDVWVAMDMVLAEPDLGEPNWKVQPPWQTPDARHPQASERLRLPSRGTDRSRSSTCHFPDSPEWEEATVDVGEQTEHSGVTSMKSRSEAAFERERAMEKFHREYPELINFPSYMGQCEEPPEPEQIDSWARNAVPVKNRSLAKVESERTVEERQLRSSKSSRSGIHTKSSLSPRSQRSSTNKPKLSQSENNGTKRNSTKDNSAFVIDLDDPASRIAMMDELARIDTADAELLQKKLGITDRPSTNHNFSREDSSMTEEQLRLRESVLGDSKSSRRRRKPSGSATKTKGGNQAQGGDNKQGKVASSLPHPDKLPDPQRHAEFRVSHATKLKKLYKTSSAESDDGTQQDRSKLASQGTKSRPRSVEFESTTEHVPYSPKKKNTFSRFSNDKSGKAGEEYYEPPRKPVLNLSKSDIQVGPGVTIREGKKTRSGPKKKDSKQTRKPERKGGDENYSKLSYICERNPSLQKGLRKLKEAARRDSLDEEEHGDDERNGVLEEEKKDVFEGNSSAKEEEHINTADSSKRTGEATGEMEHEHSGAEYPEESENADVAVEEEKADAATEPKEAFVAMTSTIGQQDGHHSGHAPTDKEADQHSRSQRMRERPSPERVRGRHSPESTDNKIVSDKFHSFARVQNSHYSLFRYKNASKADGGNIATGSATSSTFRAAGSMALRDSSQYRASQELKEDSSSSHRNVFGLSWQRSRQKSGTLSVNNQKKALELLGVSSRRQYAEEDEAQKSDFQPHTSSTSTTIDFEFSQSDS